MPPPPYVTALESRNTSWREKLLGGCCFGLFVATWISSILSPFILLLAILYKYWMVAAFVILITLTAYLPWRKGFLAKSIHAFLSHYAPMYFRSVAVIFEGNELPKPTATTASTGGSGDPQPTFYAIHPHGAFCIGWALLFVHDAMQHVRFCFAPALYISPFFRLFSRCAGNPGSAAKFAMISYMKKGLSLALPPGGFEEATLTSLVQDRVFIKRRTGFIRLCLKYGIQVRPVYVFGEKLCYWNIQGYFSQRLALNRYGLPTILTWGHPLFPLVPKSGVDLRIVVGAPLVLPKIENPTQQDVKVWHDKYIAALAKLFDDHKEQAYGPEAAKVAKLEIW